VKNPNWTNKNWLKSSKFAVFSRLLFYIYVPFYCNIGFHFSFAEYNNPRNTEFGVLRVMNDDLVQPNRGFGEHPHRDAEICTYVVDGNLTHQDSMGTQETLTRGAVQFMTAGRGVSHSEYNQHPSEPLRFIQMWITPRSRGLDPNYGSYSSTEDQRLNQWAHLVSDIRNDAAACNVKVQQDVNIFVTELEPGRDLTLNLESDRQAYTLCIEGAVNIAAGSEEVSLAQHDASELYGEGGTPFIFRNAENSAKVAHVLVVEMQRKGEAFGRTDL
jgi:redox-sensitive bicupin YhaK (pirin superfamily)